MLVKKLNSLAINKMKKPGHFSDGEGLYLQIFRGGTKSWIFRYMLGGRNREMGLGPLSTVGLAEARKKASDCRRVLLEGLDPIDSRKEKALALAVSRAKSKSFEECSMS